MKFKVTFKVGETWIVPNDLAIEEDSSLGKDSYRYGWNTPH